MLSTNVYKKNQRDATWQYVYLWLQYCSTCFGRFLRPSSGALRNCSSSLWWVTWDGVRCPTRRPRSMASTLSHTVYRTGSLVASHSPEAATTVSKCSWRWTQKASETRRTILQLQINILPNCIRLVLLYILTYDARKPKQKISIFCCCNLFPSWLC